MQVERPTSVRKNLPRYTLLYLQKYQKDLEKRPCWYQIQEQKEHVIVYPTLDADRHCLCLCFFHFGNLLRHYYSEELYSNQQEITPRSQNCKKRSEQNPTQFMKNVSL